MSLQADNCAMLVFKAFNFMVLKLVLLFVELDKLVQLLLLTICALNFACFRVIFATKPTNHSIQIHIRSYSYANSYRSTIR